MNCGLPSTERPILADWLRSLPKPAALLACNNDRSKQILAACKIARLLQCTEVKNLARYFRQRTGLTPAQYRQRHSVK